MLRPKKLCRKPDCTNFRPCPTPGHEPTAWEGSTRSKRLPSNWPKLRRFILERDPICQICHRHLATEADHIEAGDDHSPSNLQGVCTTCHKKKSSREGHEARRQIVRNLL